MFMPLHQAIAQAVGRKGQIIKPNPMTTNLPYADDCANVTSHALCMTPLEAGAIFMPFLQVSYRELD